MAAPIPLSAPTLEGQVMEICRDLAVTRRNFVATNPTISTQGLQITENISLSANTISFAITLPIEVTSDLDGGLSIDVIDALPAVIG